MTLAPDIQAEVDARRAKGISVPTIGATDTTTGNAVDAAYIRHWLFTTTLKPGVDMSRNVGAAPADWTPRNDPTQETYEPQQTIPASTIIDGSAEVPGPAPTATATEDAVLPGYTGGSGDKPLTEASAASESASSDAAGVSGLSGVIGSDASAASPAPAAHEGVVEKIEHVAAEAIHEVEHLVDEAVEKVREVL